MESENDSIKSHTESEEDDFGCYFLQPSSAPYNITEKVQKANVDLFNSQPNQTAEKTAKVKFREELISFEPDLTDDDVNSIESDNTEQSLDHRTAEYKTTINAPDGDNVTIFNIEEDVEELEEVLEEVESDSEYKPEIKVSHAAPEGETTSSRKESSKRVKKLSRSKAAFLNPPEVHCRDHCVDKLDRLSLSIGKLDIQDKEALPPLQLLQRKCCDEVKKRIPQNLPQYNGLRSEYGLSSGQLEKREKQRETLRMRERLRQQLMEEYRRRRMQQNEEVFCQWLKEVSKRKSATKRAASAKASVSVGKPERPKTANAFIPRTKTKKKRRPQSTNARVYIEVPRSCLEKRFRIGDLTITNSKLFSRNVHIITIS